MNCAVLPLSIPTCPAPHTGAACLPSQPGARLVVEGGDNPGRPLRALGVWQGLQCLLPDGFPQLLARVAPRDWVAVLVLELDEHGTVDEPQRRQVVKGLHMFTFPGGRKPERGLPVLERMFGLALECVEQRIAVFQLTSCLFNLQFRETLAPQRRFF